MNNQKPDFLKKELERRSNDEFVVFNPTGEDYPLKWGGLIWNIPNRDKDIGYGLGRTVLPRYLTTHYIKHISAKLINLEYNDFIAKERKKYKGDFWPAYEERVAVNYRTDNKERLEKWQKILVIGLKRKFGLDEMAEPDVEEVKDRKSVDEDINAMLDEAKEISEDFANAEEKPVVKEETTSEQEAKEELIKQIT